MYETYVPGFSNYLMNTALGGGGYASGEQGLPAEQPVQAEAVPPEVDLGGWNLANFQNQFMQPGGAGALSDYIGQQAAGGKLYTSPIGDSLTSSVLMPGALSGVLDLYGSTPEEQALRYYNLKSRDTTVPITFDPRTYSGGYQLVDASGKVLGSASSPDQLEALVNQAGGMTGSGDQYSVQGLRGNGEADTIYQQKPDYGTLGNMLPYMLAMAAAGYGLSAAGLGAAGAGGGAAGAGGAGGIAGGTAGAGGVAGTGGAAAGGLGGLAAAAEPLITVIGAPAAGLGTAGSLALGGTLAGGLAAAAAAPGTGAVNYGDQLWGAQPDAPITVVGNPANLGVGTVPGVTAGGALAGGAALGSGTAAPPVEQPVDPEIVVEASGITPPATLPLEAITTLPGLTTLAPNTGNIGIPETPLGQPAPSLLDKVSGWGNYLQLAGLGIGALGSLFGGGGGNQTGGRWPGGATPNPTFSASLPTANIPGLTGATSGPRTASELGARGLNTKQDWYRYGYGPQQSFFKHVTPGAPNTSQAFTGYAAGGSVVEGPGDGREDKIPAMLSDGEYVMDAETVALLGNGSNKAGADLLDQFRVNIRKHKGRELARGGFSEDAMRPEHYLAGGLA